MQKLTTWEIYDQISEISVWNENEGTYTADANVDLINFTNPNKTGTESNVKQKREWEY